MILTQLSFVHSRIIVNTILIGTSVGFITVSFTFLKKWHYKN